MWCRGSVNEPFWICFFSPPIPIPQCFAKYDAERCVSALWPFSPGRVMGLPGGCSGPTGKATDKVDGGPEGADTAALFALVFYIQFRNKVYKVRDGMLHHKTAPGVPNHKKALTD